MGRKRLFGNTAIGGNRTIDTFGDIADDNGTDAYPEDDQA